MAEVDQVELQGHDTQPVSLLPPPNGDRRWLWGLVLVVAVLVAGLAYWWLRREAEDPPSAETPAAATPRAAAGSSGPAAADDPGPIPALNESDSFVRRLAAQLSSHPALAEWLANDELVRRFTASVVNIADGELPYSHVGFLAPERAFATERSDGRLRPAAGNAQRYGTLVTVLESIDPHTLADFYRGIEPVVDDAYSELGYPGESFRDALHRAIDRLLETPVVESPELVEKLDSYEYADPRLEHLEPAQKALLRTGPENQRRIQERLRQFQAALGDRD